MNLWISQIPTLDSIVFKTATFATETGPYTEAVSKRLSVTLKMKYVDHKMNEEALQRMQRLQVAEGVSEDRRAKRESPKRTPLNEKRKEGRPRVSRRRISKEDLSRIKTDSNAATKEAISRKKTGNYLPLHTSSVSLPWSSFSCSCFGLTAWNPKA